MDEIWKVIEDSDGHYFISNTGRMRREAYSFISKKNARINHKEKEYTPSFNKKNGYYQYNYRLNNGNRKKEYVHRLVALHFINNPKPDIYDQVNHIDCNKGNNVFTNLEWCNEKTNMEHASKNGLINKDSEKRKKQAAANGRDNAYKHYIAVAEYDENGNLININEKSYDAQCFRLSYNGHYFRQVKILKSLYGEVPKSIDINRIDSIRNKRRKLYISTDTSGNKKTYRQLSDLPITRERLWFCFNHEIADCEGRTWEIIDIKDSNEYKDFINKQKQAVEMLKSHTYKEVAAYFNVEKSTIQRWRNFILNN